LKRPAIIALSALVCVLAFLVYLRTRPAPGLEPMGDGDSAIVAWLALATAIVSLLATLVGLVQKLIELRQARP
jgi:hypothetical protein